MDDDIQSCGNCRFAWLRPKLNPEASGTRLMCRRFPPLPDTAPWGQMRPAAWPIVGEEHWCGEYQPG